MFEPYAPPHVPDSVFHLPSPAEFQSCRPSCSSVLHAGCAIFVNQQFEVRVYFLVEVALGLGDGAAEILTTDLSHAYVEENSAYSS